MIPEVDEDISMIIEVDDLEIGGKPPMFKLPFSGNAQVKPMIRRITQAEFFAGDVFDATPINIGLFDIYIVSVVKLFAHNLCIGESGAEDPAKIEIPPFTAAQIQHQF